ncbi:uncharacterized protein UTRI_05010_B [Ustilago trichophora]|uniref:Uncharacterized protein n=1 Tax=Ustilago trichophora TaxID=86804 RepID=A0A5C3EHH7_9BASI|nr:uncharacterized protein UTRI_05010_B [Ustilago trichophora]
MAQDPLAATFIDTHITATLTGVVIGVSAIIRKRQIRPLPLAYLTARYTLLIGISALAWLTLPITQGGTGMESSAVHWLRAVVVPLLFTSTSAVLGYRALIVHFDQPRLISRLIHTLLALEFVGGITVTTLAVADPDDPQKKKFGSLPTTVSPAWISAPLLIAITIDAIFTLIVVVPILRRGERPRKGEVVHMLLSDATFFGIFSIVVKAIALGLTLSFHNRSTNPYLPVRVESVMSTIFACRIFRGQETFLRRSRERKADPSLRPIELDEFYSETVSARGGELGSGRGDLEKGEVVGGGCKVAGVEGDCGIGGGREEEVVERKGSMETVRWKATVTLTDCVDGESGGDKVVDASEMEMTAADQMRRQSLDEAYRRQLYLASPTGWSTPTRTMSRTTL